MIRTLIASVALLGVVTTAQATGFTPLHEQVGFEELNKKKETRSSTRNTRTFTSGNRDLHQEPVFQDAFTSFK